MSDAENTHTFTFNAHLGVYAVAFLDLLGQREAMRPVEAAFEEFAKRHHLFETKDQATIQADPAAQAMAVALDRSVMTIRRFFERYELYAADTAKSMDAWLDSAAAPDQRAVAVRLSRPGIKRLRFSDGLVLYVPMFPSREQGLGSGLFHLLLTCGYLWIAQLADGQPIRGGIDVAAGVAIEDGDLLGPALVNAYTLESKIADYPRIVVGRGVGTFCERMLDGVATDKGTQVDQRVAHIIRELICQAPDGASMIHVLGKRFREIGHRDLGLGMIDRANAFVNSEHERWRADGSERGHRLLAKYERLKGYFDGR